MIRKEIRLRPLFGGCLGMYLGAWILNTLLSRSVFGTEIRLSAGILFSLAAGIWILRFCLGRSVHHKVKAKRESGAETIGSWFPFILALLIGCSAAGWLTWKEELQQEYYDSFSGKEASVTGIVTDVIWSGSYGGYYTVHIDTVDGEKESFQISLEADSILEFGCGIRGTITFEKLGGQQTDDTEQRNYSRSKGIQAEATENSLRVTDKQPSPSLHLLLWGKSVQKYFSNIFIRLLGDDAGGFAAALFLGNRSVLPDHIKRDFTRLGISHILALSGMHLTVVTGFAGAIGRWIGKRWEIGFSVTAALLYMTISGFSSSVTRAGIMLLICMFLKISGKSSDSFTNLGIAVCTILLFSPGACRDVSLLLSFWGVLAVLLYNRATKTPVLAPEKKTRKGISSLILKKLQSFGNFLLLSICVVLFMLPLNCLLFGQFSLLAPLSCVAFTPLATVLLWMLPILLLISPSPLFTGILLPAVQWILDITITLAGKLSELRGICVSLQYPFAPILTIAIFCFILWAFCASPGKRLLPVISTATAVLVLLGSIVGWRILHADQTIAAMVSNNVTAVRAEKNDAIVITSGEDTLLIDNSAGGFSIFRQGIASSEKCYCTEIEAVMLTHPHKKHVTSLEKLWNQQRVRQIWIPNEDTEICYQIYEKASAAGIKIVTYTPGETLSFGNAQVITYENGFLERSVQPIVRVDITASGERMIYLGAAYAEAFSLEEFKATPARVIWFGSHGPLYKKDMDVSNLPIYSVFCTGNAKEYMYTGNILPSNSYFQFGKK